MIAAGRDRSWLAGWWSSLDRVLLAGVLALVLAGVVLSLAASPFVATRKGLPAFHFVERHIAASMLGMLVLAAASMLKPARVLAVGALLLPAALVAMVAAILIGPEINGARRWLRVAGFSLQPSELLKPGFVIVVAWLFAAARGGNAPRALPLAFVLYAMTTVLLLVQPDVGQWVLLSTVAALLFFISGQPLRWAAAAGALGAGGIATAYLVFPHVRSRIARYLDPAAGDSFQIERALRSIAEGGLLGRGPGEGTIKSVLPDAHTDFILAVVAEEYGAIACLVLIATYAFLVVRGLAQMHREDDVFVSLATIGLVLLIGLQAAINIAVNLGLVPAKGMTLPFISAGGSSLISASLTAGLVLALTRRRVDPSRVGRPDVRLTMRLAGPPRSE